MSIEEIKDQVAKEAGHSSWSQLLDTTVPDHLDNPFNEVCKRYATECCKATLEKIKKKGINVVYTGDPIQYAEADISKITDESNITLL